MWQRSEWILKQGEWEIYCNCQGYFWVYQNGVFKDQFDTLEQALGYCQINGVGNARLNE